MGSVMSYTDGAILSILVQS